MSHTCPSEQSVSALQDVEFEFDFLRNTKKYNSSPIAIITTKNIEM